MTAVPPIVCAGRSATDTLAAAGEVCGRIYRGAGWALTEPGQREQARAAGWSVAGPPMCPRCRRPDPEVTRGLLPTLT